MRRRLVPLLMLVALTPAAALAGVAAKASWAQPQITVVSARGLMGGRAATFRPDAPLTQSALERLVADLTDRKNRAPAAPNDPATMAELDAALVRGLGLGDAAAAFAATARAAGLKPPARFGTEVVARLLGLRTNHSAGQDSLELLPADAATRAEAAYSAARVLSLEDWEAERVREAALDFQLPALTPWQARILRTAVSLIGYPYIWGGTSDAAQAPFGSPAPGGFDCSGFVWRVYKLQQYADATQLAQAIRGRTTMQMSAEVAKRERIRNRRASSRATCSSSARVARSPTGAGRPHRDLPRRRLADPLVRLRRRAGAAERLVRIELRLGAPAARRSTPRLTPRIPRLPAQITPPGDAGAQTCGDNRCLAESL